MANVRYDGDFPVTVNDLTATAHNPIEPGDVVEAPDGFSHAHFVETEEAVTNARSLNEEDVVAPDVPTAAEDSREDNGDTKDAKSEGSTADETAADGEKEPQA